LAVAAKIGLELVNVNITDINDASGKIEAQGKKAAAESIEKARIAEALERRKGASGVAEAEKLRDTEVAVHVAEKDIVRPLFVLARLNFTVQVLCCR